MKPRPIKLKRVYEQPSLGDGTRILVDRLWPRGLSREEASADFWPDVLELLDDLRRRTPLTLIYGARDGKHSHAVVLREVLEEREIFNA